MTVFNFRLPFPLLQDLKSIARAMNKGVSEIIREALNEWLAKRGFTAAASAAA